MIAYRNPSFPWFGCFIGLCGAGLLAGFSGIWSSESPDPIGMLLSCGLVGFGWLGGVRPSIVADRDGVTAINLVKTVAVPWEQITEFWADDRVNIRTTDGRDIRCWAVQRARAAGLTSRPSIVDRVTADLNRLHRRHREDER